MNRITKVLRRLGFIKDKKKDGLLSPNYIECSTCEHGLYHNSYHNKYVYYCTAKSKKEGLFMTVDKDFKYCYTCPVYEKNESKLFAVQEIK